VIDRGVEQAISNFRIWRRAGSAVFGSLSSAKAFLDESKGAARLAPALRKLHVITENFRGTVVKRIRTDDEIKVLREDLGQSILCLDQCARPLDPSWLAICRLVGIETTLQRGCHRDSASRETLEWDTGTPF